MFDKAQVSDTVENKASNTANQLYSPDLFKGISGADNSSNANSVIKNGQIDFNAHPLAACPAKPGESQGNHPESPNTPKGFDSNTPKGFDSNKPIHSPLDIPPFVNNKPHQPEAPVSKSKELPFEPNPNRHEAPNHILPLKDLPAQGSGNDQRFLPFDPKHPERT